MYIEGVCVSTERRGGVVCAWGGGCHKTQAYCSVDYWTTSASLLLAIRSGGQGYISCLFTLTQFKHAHISSCVCVYVRVCACVCACVCVRVYVCVRARARSPPSHTHTATPIPIGCVNSRRPRRQTDWTKAAPDCESVNVGKTAESARRCPKP